MRIYIHGNFHIVMFSRLTVDFSSVGYLRCAEILKMAKAKDMSRTKQGKSKEKLYLMLQLSLTVHKMITEMTHIHILFVIFYSILFFLHLSSSELSLVCQSDIVYFNPGDDVVLSCHLKPAISAASMEIMWWNKEDLVCHYKDGQMIESCEGRVSLSLKDLLNGNVSLTLRDVRRSQKGLCICQVIHECQTLQDTVFLHISCKSSTKHVWKIFNISQNIFSLKL